MKSTRLIIGIAMLIFLAGSIAGYAQGPGFDTDVADEDVPIDGGASLVALAAIGYGLKKMKDNKSGKNKEHM